MTKHKPDCALVSAICTCGLVKPAPPAPTADEVREAQKQIAEAIEHDNTMQLYRCAKLGHIHTLLRHVRSGGLTAGQVACLRNVLIVLNTNGLDGMAYEFRAAFPAVFGKEGGK